MAIRPPPIREPIFVGAPRVAPVFLRPGRRGQEEGDFFWAYSISRPDPTFVVPAQDVGLADENEFLTVQFDWGRSVFLVEDLIARFEDRRLEDLFLFPFGFTSPLLFRCFPAPLPHGQDLSFYRFLLGRVGDEYPPGGLFLGLRRVDQYPIL